MSNFDQEFSLQQAKTKAQIRVREGRPHPIDLMALEYQLLNSTDLIIEGFNVDKSLTEIINELDLEQLLKLVGEMDTFIDGSKYWANLKFLCECAIKQKTQERRISKLVDLTIDETLQKMSPQSLNDLELQVRKKLNAGQIDLDYWESMLESILIWKCNHELNQFRTEVKQMIENTPNRKTLQKSVPNQVFDEFLISEQKEYSYTALKPKYSTKVIMGFEWTKYNQMHYNLKNPPPNVVLGYQFNIEYPKLKQPPKYFVEEYSKFKNLLRFQGEEPYSDLCFLIEPREWERSYKKGFKCLFEFNVLQLHFFFKKY